MRKPKTQTNRQDSRFGRRRQAETQEEWAPQVNPESGTPRTVRYAAVVEYDGSPFCGWQYQDHSPSVQQVVETALSKVADAPVSVHCAGRTDTGVHATYQVIHFDSAANRTPDNWLLGANANMPLTVRIHWLQQVDPQFHARFSALSRTYRYIICNQPVKPALFHSQLTWEKMPLDADAMQAATAFLPGEQDFSAFRAAGCQSNSPFRNVHHAKVWRDGNLVILEICANAFLHHMVRNIAGSLIVVGRGQRKPAWVGELMAGKDRSKAAITAPASGLYLVRVAYQDAFNLPGHPLGPQFILNGP